MALGGGGETETRKRKGRRRKTAKAQEQLGGSNDVSVTKADPSPAPPGTAELAKVVSPTVILGSPNTAVPQIISPGTVVAQMGGKANVIIGQPKKKGPKVVFVPKAKGGRPVLKKTFKAKRFRVVIDNTAKTLKARKQTLGRLDSMTDEQVRAAALSAKLIGAERAKKAPASLLRQMLKDYQTMRGALL